MLPCALAGALLPAPHQPSHSQGRHCVPALAGLPLAAVSAATIRPISPSAESASSRGYSITFQRRSHSEKRGPQTEILYRAEVRELPSPDADGNNFAGAGRYSVHAIQEKANCHNDLPVDREVIEGEGTLRATATVSGPANSSFIVFSLTPTSGPRLHLFTRSFRALEQKVAGESGTGEEDLPFLASAAVGGVDLAPDSGGYRKEGGIGPNDCDGMIVITSSAHVVRIGAPCKNKAPELTAELEAERNAFVKGMQDAGYGVGAEHVTVVPGNLTRFGVRLAGSGCILPTIESIQSRCPASGSQKGAKRLLVGAVQHAGNTTRVTARIVEAETAVVLDAAKADADGSGAAATAAAMAQALKQLKLKAGCVE